MTPEQFIALWQGNKLSERGGAQSHFNDLCDLLGVDKPRDPDNYCFERGAKKTSGGDGWADVWKRNHFAWENKKPGRDLKAAYKQLWDYTPQLDYPPLLVVCDREIIEIHTAFTGYPHEVRRILIADLAQAEAQQTLRYVFTNPEKLRPTKSVAAITEEAAGQFGALAEGMRQRQLPAAQVAHFLIQCLFCMFAEDELLLPQGLFTQLLHKNLNDPTRASNRLEALFKAMQKGGDYGDDVIRWFNGGLFKKIDIPVLTGNDLIALYAAASMDWRAIDPSIFGTLFERGLDPDKRSQLGAHYTDRDSILRIINPVVVEPLRALWQQTRSVISATLGKSKKHNDKSYKEANSHFVAYLETLRNFRVLDPACGSGNFLYLALKALKDLEHQANIDAAELGLQRQVSIETSPANVLGIELDPYAAELARVTVWIGEIQWMQQYGYSLHDKPLLKPLDHIENRDALLNADGSAATWPACDAIVGNPPFLGGSKKSGELGRDYFNALNAIYENHVPGGADLVCYWFHKAREQIVAGQCQRAGLVTTQSIRNGSNRKVLDAITQEACIYNAWSDEPWVNEGAAVRVSLVSFGRMASSNGNRVGTECPPYANCYLDGQAVTRINADLTAGGEDNSLDLTTAQALAENASTAFQGSQKIGAFDLPGELARQMLKNDGNPNNRPNSDVLKPNFNGMDLTQNRRDVWIVDFGLSLSVDEAALYEKPFQYIDEWVKPERLQNNREAYRKYWWRHGEGRVAMRAAIAKLPRYIATAETAKHRCFAWLESSVLPDKKLIVIARADDTSFGVVHSRFHEVWSLAQGSVHGDGVDGGRPRYTPSTIFETFPFPPGLTPADTVGAAISEGELQLPPVAATVLDQARAIASAAVRLNQLRNNWLNPAEWVEWVITPEEEKAGFPPRVVAKAGFEAQLKKRTLTNLYNERPTWLSNAHKALDQAVALAYGWSDYTAEMPDDEILRRLLQLNLQRANAETA